MSLAPSYDALISDLLPAYALEEESVSASTAAMPSVPTPLQRLDLKKFIYEIPSIWNKPWAKLTLLGHPRLSRTTPTFLEGSNIEGSVKLSLSSQDHIDSVVIYVRGDLVTSGEERERLNFFRLRHYLWNRDMGDPRAPIPPSRTTPTLSADKWQENLHGEYLWPFSIKIPDFLSPRGPNGEAFRLPHTFAESASRASLEYYLQLRINRGRFRNDDSVMTQFGFFSMQQPDRAPPLRELAYQNGTDVPGPYLDPDGWHTLESVSIRGTVFGERDVDAKCTVSLAKPLCYPRSTSIPCFMTIETTDAQAADLLASVKKSAVYLQRRVKCTFGGETSDAVPCGQAVWLSVNAEGADKRHMMGEIHLRRDLQPSSAIKQFQVEYDVVVFPPAVAAFKPASNGPLITHRVEIVTRFAQGARPPLVKRPVYEPNDALVDKYYKSLPAAPPRKRPEFSLKRWAGRPLS